MGDDFDGIAEFIALRRFHTAYVKIFGTVPIFPTLPCMPGYRLAAAPRSRRWAGSPRSI